MAVVALDSVAMIAYLDASNPFHTSAATAIEAAARTGALTASVVGYAELLTGVELGYRDRAVAEMFLEHVVARIEPVDVEVANRAAQLRGVRRTLRLPDALILATADLHADQVITGDGDWAQLAEECRVEITVLTAA